MHVDRLCNYLRDEHNEFILSKQLLLPGTYVGARVKADLEAESKSGLIHHMSVALEKASETEYWLNLLHDASYLDKKSFE